jgi:hypothetical protein
LQKNSKIAKIFLSVILFLFLFGVIKLFIMRFEAGDVYPVYSSLRADPLGTKVFYESLNNLQDISTSRNYQPLSKIGDGRTATIFYFGLRADSLKYVDSHEVKKLEAMATKGSQLVILFYPEKKNFFEYKEKEKEKWKTREENSRDVQKKESQSPAEDYYEHNSYLEKHWGFVLAYNKLSDETEAAGKLAVDKYSLPQSISWHSALYFDRLDSAWKNVYTLKEYPVFIERNFGKGRIILSTDTYFVSNEALRKERHPELLVWLVGNNKEIIFDETHLGINENPGIAALAREYHLHGFFAGVILLGALFIWKNSFSLVPPYDESLASYEGNLSAGKDYISGFASLLRRNITAPDLLTVCFNEWGKTFHYRLRNLNNELKQIQSIIESDKKLPTKEQNPLSAYKQISKILSERKIK